MRAVLAAAIVACAPLLACNQDSASSNAERDTHMGVVRAAVPAEHGQDQSEAAAAAPAPGAPASVAPATAPVLAVPSDSASAPPSGSNSAPAGQGHGLPDAGTKKKNP
jgi:hypothetical protein